MFGIALSDRLGQAHGEISLARPWRPVDYDLTLVIEQLDDLVQDFTANAKFVRGHLDVVGDLLVRTAVTVVALRAAVAAVRVRCDGPPAVLVELSPVRICQEARFGRARDHAVD